jgi:SPOR domain
MRSILFIISLGFGTAVLAQDSLHVDSVAGMIKIIKDPRLDILAAKQAEFGKSAASAPAVLGGRTAGRGYRVMVLNSNDKELAMKVRAQLLQHFPEQKLYMSFQAPYIKIKFGDFLDRNEADRYKKMIINGKLVSSSVYVVSDIIEIKVDKNKEKEKEENRR